MTFARWTDALATRLVAMMSSRRGHPAEATCLDAYKDMESSALLLYGGSRRLRTDAGPAALVARPSGFDDAIPDRVPHELTHRVELELGHDVPSVCFRGLGGDPEHDADLLVGLTFGEQL